MFQVRECLISCITCTSSIQHCQINSLHAGLFYMLFYLLLIFQSQLFRNTISVSLDPDQARGFVEPNLGPNCFQRFSAGNMSRQSINFECWVILHACFIIVTCRVLFSKISFGNTIRVQCRTVWIQHDTNRQRIKHLPCWVILNVFLASAESKKKSKNVQD